MSRASSHANTYEVGASNGRPSGAMSILENHVYEKAMEQFNKNQQSTDGTLDSQRQVIVWLT